MLNSTIQQKILSALHGHVLSTSMVARKTKLSRVTVSKYLAAMQSRSMVNAVRIGKAVAWRAHETKPIIGIIAKPGTARIIKLALGERYAYQLATSMQHIKGAFVVITDNAAYASTTTVPVVLISAEEREEVYTLPELFDTTMLKVLIKKLYFEQLAPLAEHSAFITIEGLDDCEEMLGIYAADELVKMTARLLRESKLSARQYERSAFLVDGEIPEGVFVDVEQTFHLILAHIYGRMVHPGEEITVDGTTHRVPSLIISFDALAEEEDIELER